MRVIRRVWVISVNVVCIGVLLLSFVRSFQIASYNGARWTAGLMTHELGPVICSVVLVIGITLELFNSRFAWVVNVGFFAFVGLAVLIQALFFKSDAQYSSERGLIVALVGIPFSVIAIIDSVLYMMARRVASEPEV